jgi:hypothetical protein
MNPSMRVCMRAWCGLVLAACSSSTPASPTDAGAGGEAAPPEAGADATGDAGKPPSPAILRSFESGAEAMSESARGGLPAHVADWQGAQDAYIADSALWQQVKPVVVVAGAKPATIREIESALAAFQGDVMGQMQRAAESDANRITLAVPDLFDLFTYAAPTDTLRLDGTFRQLQIDAEFSDFANCQKDLDDTIAVWTRLKPLVAAQAPTRTDVMGAATVVQDVDGNLQLIQTFLTQDAGGATESADVEVQAQTGLDQTDICEQVFVGTAGCLGPHFVVDPLDHRCKLDGHTTNVGAMCSATNPGVCGIEQSASCLDPQLDGWPGGYCNVDPCTNKDGSLCPVGASCVMINGENGQCFRNCAADTDCRTAEGYFCLDMTADDHPGGNWISGASHSICVRPVLECPNSPKDCPAARPHCVLPNDGGPAFVDSGAADAGGVDGAASDAGAGTDAAPVAPPTPTCAP